MAQIAEVKAKADQLRKTLAKLDRIVDQGQKERDRKADWSAENTSARRNVAPIPAVVDPERRERCRKSLRLFLETYFPNAFPMQWSNDHLEVIGKTETAVVRGGKFAVAMPRASGKTTINLRAAIWALNYGLRPYVFIVAADAAKAKGALKSIKTEYYQNHLLYQDFPEICKPVRELGAIAQAAAKQNVDGEPTFIEWTAETLRLPTVKGSLASGGMIGVGGITGASRGAQVTLSDGRILRPSLILVDDFQTRESAASATQCKTRLDTLTGDLCGMAGPTEPVSILVTATVIYRDDAADQLLNRKRFPEFHGTRKKMVYEWPTNESLWEEYEELRKRAFREDREPTESDRFVKDNFDAMHAGSKVAWPERKYEGTLSALQHAYNLKINDPDAFASEYQNEPVTQTINDLAFLTEDQIAEKLTNRPKGRLPSEVEHIVSAIDVQGNSLWYVTVAWCAGFTGYVADYGVFPEQNRRYFKQSDLPVTFASLWPTLSEEESIYKALDELVNLLAAKRWKLDNGAEVGVSKILIDEGWKDSIIHLFCKQSSHRLVLAPAKGWGVQAGRDPMNAWKKTQSEKVGWNWRLRLASKSERTLKHLLWDTNSWKTFVQERLAVSQGGQGCLSICGEKPAEHRLFASHLTSEKCTRTEGKGRTVIEWRLPPSRPDNHWLDGLSMCAVGGSMCGVNLLQETTPRTKKPKLSLSEYARLARK